MKKLMLILLLLPLVFAAGSWQGIAAIAIALSLGILGAVYGLGIGFGINELQLTAKEEFYQLIATAVLVILLVGSNSLLDGISTNLGAVAGAPTLQDAAISTLNDSLNHDPSDNIRTGVQLIYNNVVQDDNKLTVEGSKTLSCSILGIGYSVSACGGYAMLSAPLSMAGGIVGFATGELYSMQRLILISQTYAMNLLLPLGLVLRTFKFTRGAGGLIIALAISMYIMLPAGIVFNQMLVDTFMDPGNPAAVTASAPYRGAMTTNIDNYACDAGNVVFSGGSGENDAAKSAFASLEADLRKIVFSALVVGTLGPVLSLLMMMGSLRALSAAAGADVDVSAISRFI